MFDLGGGELLLIVLAVLVFFGPKKLPELAQSLGRGMREFKRAQREFTEQITQAVSDDQFKQKAKRDVKQPDGSVARKTSARASNDDDTHHDFVNEFTEEDFRAEQLRNIQMNGAAVVPDADPTSGASSNQTSNASPFTTADPPKASAGAPTNSSAPQTNVGPDTPEQGSTDSQTHRS